MKKFPLILAPLFFVITKSLVAFPMEDSSSEAREANLLFSRAETSDARAHEGREASGTASSTGATESRAPEGSSLLLDDPNNSGEPSSEMTTIDETKNTKTMDSLKTAESNTTPIPSISESSAGGGRTTLTGNMDGRSVTSVNSSHSLAASFHEDLNLEGIQSTTRLEERAIAVATPRSAAAQEGDPLTGIPNNKIAAWMNARTQEGREIIDCR